MQKLTTKLGQVLSQVRRYETQVNVFTPNNRLSSHDTSDARIGETRALPLTPQSPPVEIYAITIDYILQVLHLAIVTFRT